MIYFFLSDSFHVEGLVWNLPIGYNIGDLLVAVELIELGVSIYKRTGLSLVISTCCTYPSSTSVITRRYSISGIKCLCVISLGVVIPLSLKIIKIVEHEVEVFLMLRSEVIYNPFFSINFYLTIVSFVLLVEPICSRLGKMFNHSLKL